MFQRQRLEKEEGKSYNEPGVCYGRKTNEYLADCLLGFLPDEVTQ